jgi:hypothetical protein
MPDEVSSHVEGGLPEVLTGVFGKEDGSAEDAGQSTCVVAELPQRIPDVIDRIPARFGLDEQTQLGNPDIGEHGRAARRVVDRQTVHSVALADQKAFEGLRQTRLWPHLVQRFAAGVAVQQVGPLDPADAYILRVARWCHDVRMVGETVNAAQPEEGVTQEAAFRAGPVPLLDDVVEHKGVDEAIDPSPFAAGCFE